MVKSAPVELVSANFICPGKFMAIVSGDMGAVRSSVRAGVDYDPENVVDSVVLGAVHEDVIPALTGTAAVPAGKGALGIIETFASSAAIKAADTAAKGGNIQLLEIRLARGLGGKTLIFLQGEVSSVRNAIKLAVGTLDPGLVLGFEVIPSAHPDLWEKLS
jgi:microcompartment protein CcmL/EutN